MAIKALQKSTFAGFFLTIRHRLAPPLFFLAALSLMVIFFYDAAYTSLPPTGQRYDLAKSNIQKLRQDKNRSALRAPWEKIAAEFKSIYDDDPNWPNRPAALFRAAEALEELAHRSFSKDDARQAIACYEHVAQRHADSRLADDALYRAAKLRAAWLKDDKTALVLLQRIKSQYSNGDMLPEALALEKALQASAKGRTAREARIVAHTDGKHALDDVQGLQSQALPAQKATDKRQAKQNNPLTSALAEKAAALPSLRPNELLSRYREAKQRLAALKADGRKTRRQQWEDLCVEFLRIYQAKKDWVVSPGALYRAAVTLEAFAAQKQLKKEYIQARDMYLALSLEFPKSALADDALFHAASIDADILQQPANALAHLEAIATLYADGDHAKAAHMLRKRIKQQNSAAMAAKASTAPAADSLRLATFTANNKNNNRVVNPRLVKDMARQLGLSINTVFIDAGHGGRDPGTQHNNIVERDIALDIALSVGRLLQANGLEVVYSRTSNITVPLRQRTVMTNAANTDIFVSIHVNAHTHADAHGFETYYLDIARNAHAARLAALENAASGLRLGNMQKMLADVMLNARADESRNLATDIQRLSISRLKRRKYVVRNNGVKSAPFLVLLGTKMPAVLVEVGYCTNKIEARNLASPQYRMAIAEGIAEGILAYRDRLREQRTVQNTLTSNSNDAI